MAATVVNTEPGITQGRTSPFDGAFELVPDPIQPQRIPISIETTDDIVPSENIPTIHDGPRISQATALQEQKPENHMTLACLSTMFCACPCGLMSLCHAIQVNTLFEQGNRIGADYNSHQAWKWGLVSVALGCLCCFIVIMYYLIYMAIHVDKIT